MVDGFSCDDVQLHLPLSPPPYSSVGLVDAYLGTNSSLYLQFNASTRWNTEGSLYLTPFEERDAPWRIHSYDSFVVLATHLRLGDGNLALIPSVRNSFFLPQAAIDVASTSSLRWNTDYAICNTGALTDGAGVNLPQWLGVFTTSPAPPLLVDQTHFDADALVRPILEDTVLVNRNRVDLRAARFYNFTAAARSLNGTGVRIGIYDTGILNGSEVAPAVAWRAIAIADEALDQYANFDRSRPSSVSNHATNMARYLLNFAPGAALYDFPTGAPRHLEQEIAAALRRYNITRHPTRVDPRFGQIELDEYAQLARMLNVSILSHSGGVDIDNRTVEMIGRAVRDGLIFAKSVGNNFGSANNITEKHCERDENFIPYMVNLTSGKGAFVAVQSALSAYSMPTNVRARADDAAPYTLTLYENGLGATSESTATFAGMMALMLQANAKYAANFTPRQLVEIMVETADPVPDNRTVFGHGLVNMGRAVERVQNRAAPSFRLYANITTSPLFLNHGFDLISNRSDECGPSPPSR